MYYKFIDGMRAFAVLSVLLGHFWPNTFPSGFLGVDIFFVISGFVVSHGSINIKQTGPDWFFYFYARRFLRILPALIFCLFITSILTIAFIPPMLLSQNIASVANFAFLGFSNFELINTAQDYFSVHTEMNPFTHTWSLGVEEQFYLIFPFLFWWSLPSRKKKSYTSFILVTFFVILSLISYKFLKNKTELFYSIVTRFWQIGFGVILFYIKHFFVSNLPNKMKVTCEVLGITFMTIGFKYKEVGSFPDLASLLVVLGITLITLSLSSDNTKPSTVKKILEYPTLVFIGKISYSLYLWHWPVLVLMKWTTGMSNGFLYLIGIGSSALCATMSYFYIENPFRKITDSLTPRKSIIIFLFGISIAVTCFFINRGLFKHRNSFSLSKIIKDAQYWENSPQSLLIRSDKRGCDVNYNEIQNSKGVWHAIFTPNEQCANFKNEHRKLFILGDSHASSYVILAKNITRETGITTTIISRTGCGFLSLPFIPTNQPKECTEYLDYALKETNHSLKAGDLMFITGLYVPRLHNISEEKFNAAKAIPPRFSEADKQAIVADLFKITTSLRNSKIKIIIDSPKPLFSTDPYRCADWFNRNSLTCNKGLYLNRKAIGIHVSEANEIIHRIINTAPEFAFFNSFEVLCPSNQDLCFPWMDKFSLYIDGDHLSPFGNLVLLEHFLNQFFLKK